MQQQRAFPFRTVLLFVVSAIVLRIGAMLGWALFPRSEGTQQLARVAIPLLFSLALIALNRWCLRRDGFAAGVLGLGFNRVGWFAVGGVVMTPIILLMAGALWLAVPFHWDRGVLSPSQFAWAFAEYIAGNSGEELIFRGYLFLVLARRLGLPWTLGITGVLFGLFHLPGLAGVSALKMIVTTALGSVIFAAAYVLSRSLWTAIGAHAWGNLLLHQGLGLSGSPALARIVLDGEWPKTYDPGFVAWTAISMPCAAVLWKLMSGRATCVGAMQ